MPPGKPGNLTTFQTVTLPGGSEENHGRQHVMHVTLGPNGKPPPTASELPGLVAIFREDVAAGSAVGAKSTATPVGVNEFGQPIYVEKRTKGPER